MHFLHRPAKTESNQKATIVMLHGRGADEHDLFGLSSHLDERFEIYALRAPYQFSWGGYAWFELFDDGSVNEQGFRSSRLDVQQFLATIDTSTLLLFGFSMGAIMSYSLALTNPDLCSGIVCMSGFAPVQLAKEYKLQGLSNLKIFMSHGLHDPVIPIVSARQTKKLLDTSNASIYYKEYDTGHEISQECLDDVTSWLSSFL